MEFWQHNKPFVIIAGLGLLGLLVLWPSLFGLGPSVVRFDGARYERAMMGHRSLEGKMKQFFPDDGAGVPIRRAAQEVAVSNTTLTGNLDAMRAWMSFIPRFPFRIPEPRNEAERKSYVSLAYTYARTGELLCDEYSLRDYSDGVVFLASTRNVPLRDTYFGMADMALPQAIKDPDTRIMQIALAHELGHLAIRLNMDEIISIVPGEPSACKLNGADIALAYPVNLRLRCDLPTLLAFLHALDGAHGHVTRAPAAPAPTAPAAPEPPDPTKPLAPKAEPAAGVFGPPGEPAPPPKKAPVARPQPDDPEDPGPGPAPKGAPAPVPPAPPAKEAPAAPPAKEAPDVPAAKEAPAPKETPADTPPAPASREAPGPSKIVISLVGSPSFLSPDASLGTLKERFTLFRRDERNPHKFQFIANAIATRVLDRGTGKLAAEDILDWRGFCARLKSQSSARESNAGKRLWLLLPPAAQAAVQDMAGDKPLDEARKADLLGALNDLLSQRRDFYREEDFASVAISNEADGLLKLDRQSLPAQDLQKLNRLLLEAAFPKEIAKSSIKLEALVEPTSDLCIPPGGQPATRNAVRENDFASTRFFFVRSLRVTAAPGQIVKDRDGYPSDVTPPHLVVELSVAALRFLEVQAPIKPAEKRPGTSERPLIHRGF